MSENKNLSFYNKKAKREYEILETLEAGIALMGSEVKSLREGKVNLDDAFAIPRNGEMFIVLDIRKIGQGNYFYIKEK